MSRECARRPLPRGSLRAAWARPDHYTSRHRVPDAAHQLNTPSTYPASVAEGTRSRQIDHWGPFTTIMVMYESSRS